MAKSRKLAEQVARAVQSGAPAPVPMVSTNPPVKQSSRAGKKGLTVYFDPVTHRKLRYVAFMRDCSIDAVIRGAVAKELATEDDPKQPIPARESR